MKPFVSCARSESEECWIDVIETVFLSITDKFLQNRLLFGSKIALSLLDCVPKLVLVSCVD